MPLVAGKDSKKCVIKGKKAVSRKAPKADPSCYQVGTKQRGVGGRVYVVKASKRWSPAEPKRGAKKAPAKKKVAKAPASGPAKKKVVAKKAPASAAKRVKSEPASCKKVDTKGRKAPGVSATCFTVNSEKKGIDGKMYVVKMVKKAGSSGRTKRWVKV